MEPGKTPSGAPESPAGSIPPARPAGIVEAFARRGVYYGWVMTGVMFLNLFFVMGSRFSFGVIYVALLDDTGWKRAETAGIFSVAMAVYALSITFSGAIFDRFGPRRMFPGALLLMSAALFLSGTVSTVTQFYLVYGVLMGVSFSLLGFPTHMALVPRWFIRRRGLASAIALGGNGVGALAMSLLAEWLLIRLGWRGTFMVYGFLVLVILVPLNILLTRDSPESIGQQPDGRASAGGAARGGGAAGATGDVTGFTLGGALATPAWWLMFFSVTMIGFTMMTMVVHQTRMSVDMGYSLLVASMLFGLTGLGRGLGGIFWGHLSDHIGRRRCFPLAAAAGVAGLLVLYQPFFHPHIMLLAGFSFLYGVGYMGITPVYASVVADLFPGRHLGKIMGTLDIGFGLGASLGPWLAGLLFDASGSHDGILLMLACATVLTGVLLTLGAGKTS
ncbi:MAG: MFS transporter [Deltaproteobacteria bacterium]|nr:MFS transporter [Deltaproteobacteria bacterium]